jgi:NAD kinase
MLRNFTAGSVLDLGLDMIAVVPMTSNALNG